MLCNDTKKRLAQKVTERLNRVEMFRGKEIRFFEIINQQANDLARYLRGELRSYKPYRLKW